MAYVELAVRSLGIVALALLCIGLFAFAVKNVLTTARDWEFAQDTARLFTAVEVERMIQDSTQPLKDSLARLALRGAQQANRHKTLLVALRDTIGVLNTSLTTQPDSVLWRQEAVRALETYEVALGEATRTIEALEVTTGAQAQMLSVAKLENDRLWTLIDSASSVIRRIPQPCRIPVVGIKCPTVVVGGVVTRQGLDVGVAFGFPLP